MDKIDEMDWHGAAASVQELADGRKSLWSLIHAPYQMFHETYVNLQLQLYDCEQYGTMPMSLLST